MSRTLAKIEMPCFDYRVETDYKTFNVYRVQEEWDAERGRKKHKIMMQKCGCMSECLAFIMDYERNATIEQLVH